MNKENIEGKFDQTKGNVNEKIGQFTGNEERENKGLGEKIVGKVKEGFGDLKDKVSDLKDQATEKMGETANKRRTA